MIEDVKHDVGHVVADLLVWARTADPSALPDLVSALGRFDDPGVARELATLVDHPQAEVRLVVAQAFEGRQAASPVVAAALVQLSVDPVEEIRSWATFALAGEQLAAVPGTYEALRARLQDPSPEVRVEAVRGLGRDADPAVVEAALDLAPRHADDPRFLEAVSRLTMQVEPLQN